MDTGVCSNCGHVDEVINPFIYSIAKLNNIGKDIWNSKENRIYIEEKTLYRRQNNEEENN